MEFRCNDSVRNWFSVNAQFYTTLRNGGNILGARKQKRKRKIEDRIERFDWILTIGEIILYLPRIFGRSIRKLFDWF